MRRYSPLYCSPPRRGYGGRTRSPPRRANGGGYGRSKERNPGSLLVRNIPLDCREPRGFAFVQFVDTYDASEAQYHMNRQIFAGKEISVVVAVETRKRPEEMRQRTRISLQRTIRIWRSAISLWTLPVSFSIMFTFPSLPFWFSKSPSFKVLFPVPNRRADYSISPRKPPKERGGDHSHRSYSPGYENDADRNHNGNGFDEMDVVSSLLLPKSHSILKYIQVR